VTERIKEPTDIRIPDSCHSKFTPSFTSTAAAFS
jgi:hypothetical protein